MIDIKYIYEDHHCDDCDSWFPLVSIVEQDIIEALNVLFDVYDGGVTISGNPSRKFRRRISPLS